MTQDSDNWQLLQDLFHLAATTPEPERERVLSDRCSDGALRQRAIKIFNAFIVDEARKAKTGLHSLFRSPP